jgi:hypothetical protein
MDQGEFLFERHALKKRADFVRRLGGGRADQEKS